MSNMIKIVCIDNSIDIDNRYDELKLNAIYKAKIFGDEYYIIYKNGQNKVFRKYRFKTLEKIRKERINKII